MCGIIKIKTMIRIIGSTKGIGNGGEVSLNKYYFLTLDRTCNGQWARIAERNEKYQSRPAKKTHISKAPSLDFSLFVNWVPTTDPRLPPSWFAYDGSHSLFDDEFWIFFSPGCCRCRNMDANNAALNKLSGPGGQWDAGYD